MTVGPPERFLAEIETRPCLGRRGAYLLMQSSSVMLPTDTDASTLARMDELYRRMTPAEKLQKVRELNLMVNSLALAGLRDGESFYFLESDRQTETRIVLNWTQEVREIMER